MEDENEKVIKKDGMEIVRVKKSGEIVRVNGVKYLALIDQSSERLSLTIMEEAGVKAADQVIPHHPAGCRVPKEPITRSQVGMESELLEVFENDAPMARKHRPSHAVAGIALKGLQSDPGPAIYGRIKNTLLS